MSLFPRLPKVRELKDTSVPSRLLCFYLKQKSHVDLDQRVLVSQGYSQHALLIASPVFQE